tara:strand:- start:5319 stop:6785 length:1467 start_codon:yes stop_codon:yes gene_type:complete
MPNLIITRTRATAPTVFRLNGAAIEELGAAGSLGTAGAVIETSGTAQDQYPINRSIVVRETIYTLQKKTSTNRPAIYKLEAPYTDNWSEIASLTSASTLTYLATGIYSTIIGNVPYIFGFYSSSGVTLGGWRINVQTEALELSSTWVTQTAPTRLCDCIMFDNLLFSMSYSPTSRVSAYDPTALSGTDIISPGFTAESASTKFVEWENELYACGLVSSGISHLTRYEGGAFVSVLSLGASVGGASDDARFTTWVTPEDPNTNGTTTLYILFYSSTDTATWKVWKCSKETTGGITAIDVSDPVLPAVFRTPTVPNLRGRWMTYKQQQAGFDPRILIYQATDGDIGEIVREYEFIDDITELQDNGVVGGDASYGWSVDSTGGGDREVTIDQPRISMEGIQRVDGAIQILYRAYGGDITSPLSIEGYWSDLGHTPKNLMTISGVSEGTLGMTGDVVEDIVGDGTLNSFNWDFAADGFIIGEAPTVVLRIFE